MSKAVLAKPAGHTAFQRKVWKACSSIPRGKVATYSQIATAIGSPKAVRAVGTALSKNPYAPTVPCHRVVRSDGKVGHYSASGGTPKKIKMLNAEGVAVKDGKVDLGTYSAKNLR